MNDVVDVADWGSTQPNIKKNKTKRHNMNYDSWANDVYIVLHVCTNFIPTCM